MKPAKGRYIAQDGDIRIEVVPGNRKQRTPAMPVISRRSGGKWDYVRSAVCADRADERGTRGCQRVGVRGITTYWRKPQ